MWERCVYSNLSHKERVLTSKRVISVDILEASAQVTTKDGQVFSGDIVVGADGNRVYWFLFMELKETLYGENIPRYTKDDEAEIVKQHFDDYILDNMTFKDLYDKRIVTTLAPLQTYVLRSGTTKDL
ncbi:unnamed protein product [Clonostachys rosea f. rosea IK726]|uniref:Uncharacterized protein n=1 Tax=Clonostachys rosea f. rosea IK726 TaxID=1349383 RepID=A0ACA9UNS0_BIOOC|nr:unnamed protein product [Clonostachys rosea f. rosea IK726]